MPKSSKMLLELRSILLDQQQEMTELRAAVQIQFIRIAQLQAELDRLPAARQRRQKALQPFTAVLSVNGNGQSHA